jgi:hypothetical protein
MKFIKKFETRSSEKEPIKYNISLVKLFRDQFANLFNYANLFIKVTSQTNDEEYFTPKKYDAHYLSYIHLAEDKGYLHPIDILTFVRYYFSKDDIELQYFYKVLNRQNKNLSDFIKIELDSIAYNIEEQDYRGNNYIYYNIKNADLIKLTGNLSIENYEKFNSAFKFNL